jgi:hypothetical protein
VGYALKFSGVYAQFYLFCCSLKNVSSASITTPVMVALFADAYDSTLSASLQGIWRLNSLVKSVH